jgi:DNA-binding XRE family transcriptional regulator
MAKPRVFLSSTYYDLRQIRMDLDRFIRDTGYEPVLNELGNIPYGKDDKLEEYCYKEINNIDILVSIIGGRFGSSSQHENKSISQVELNTAIKLNKQVYIFIEKNVYQEYQFYLENKENKKVKYKYADDIKIHEFIEFVENLPNNNTIQSFETSREITNFLKEQWAGLFQRFLQEQTRIKEINLIQGIESTSNTLNQLVKFLTQERTEKDNAINEILMSNHPAMEELQQKLSIKHRVYFTNYKELDDLLSAKGLKPDLIQFENDKGEVITDETNHYWVQYRRNKSYLLRVSDEIFDSNEDLKIFRKENWNDGYIDLIINDIESIEDDDDLPF